MVHVMPHVSSILLLSIFAILLHSSVQMPMTSERAIGLRKWMIDGGAYIHPNVQVEYFPGLGYGLKASEPIGTSEMVCVVPEHLCLHSSGKNALENITTQLAIELKKGDASFFHPFLCTLPDDVTFIPAMWSEEKILQMDISGTQTEKDLKNMLEKWSHDAISCLSKCEEAKKTAKNAQNGDDVTVVDWLWARATLQARGFSFRKKKEMTPEFPPVAVSEGKEGTEKKENEFIDVVSFIPFLTLSNHDDALGGVTKMGTGDPYPDLSFTFKTSETSKIEKNEQVFNYYGEISFQQKILSFGWVDRCTALSPEGFCITALDIERGNVPKECSENLLQSSSIEDKPVLRTGPIQIEIRSNILLASAVADRNIAKTRGAAEMSLPNDISLKLTTLRFEIRNIIRKIEEHGNYNGNRSGRIGAIDGLVDALQERRKQLISGIREKNVPTALENVQTSVGNVPKQQSAKKRSTQKTKLAKQPSTLDLEKNLAMEREKESDGECIRRVELEAVELLLAYAPTC